MTKLEHLNEELIQFKAQMSPYITTMHDIQNAIDAECLIINRANLIGKCYKLEYNQPIWYKIIDVVDTQSRLTQCSTIDVSNEGIKFDEIYHIESTMSITSDEFNIALNNMLQKINQFK